MSPQQAIRLINPDKWHITLSFMPAVQTPQAEALHDAMVLLAANTAPFDLVLKGAGSFPRPGAAAPIWIGVEGDVASLHDLAAGCRRAGQRSGARMESPKHFRPHLTLSRRRPPQHGLLWLQRLDQFRGTPWTVAELLVMESTLSGRGIPARYGIVERHALKG